MRWGRWLCAVALAVAAPQRARATGDDPPAVALAGALPAGGNTDLLFIQRPDGRSAPRVLGATRTAASAAAVKAVLLDPAHYRALIPALVGTTVVDRRVPEKDRKSTRLNSSHYALSRMPSSA